MITERHDAAYQSEMDLTHTIADHVRDATDLHDQLSHIAESCHRLGMTELARELHSIGVTNLRGAKRVQSAHGQAGNARLGASHEDIGNLLTAALSV